MTDPDAAPPYDVIETPTGAIYRFRLSSAGEDWKVPRAESCQPFTTYRASQD